MTSLWYHQTYMHRTQKSSIGIYLQVVDCNCICWMWFRVWNQCAVRICRVHILLSTCSNHLYFEFWEKRREKNSDCELFVCFELSIRAWCSQSSDTKWMFLANARLFSFQFDFVPPKIFPKSLWYPFERSLLRSLDLPKWFRHILDRISIGKKKNAEKCLD